MEQMITTINDLNNHIARDVSISFLDSVLGVVQRLNKMYGDYEIIIKILIHLLAYLYIPVYFLVIRDYQ